MTRKKLRKQREKIMKLKYEEHKSEEWMKKRILSMEKENPELINTKHILGLFGNWRNEIPEPQEVSEIFLSN